MGRLQWKPAHTNIYYNNAGFWRRNGLSFCERRDGKLYNDLPSDCRL